MIDAAECEFSEIRLQLQPGERLVLYSDGISEAHNASGEVFEAARIIDSITRSRHLALDASLDALLADLAAFTGGKTHDDDISLLVIERAP
jgi:sigma-B regulation protein RsbU (phosphoserine phosphatase)